MASVNSWLSPGVMHALGWTLIHSLWQCLGVAALAAVVMIFSRRPSIRYLVALSALVAMLALPVATFFLLMRPTAPVHVVLPASSGAFVSAAPVIADAPAVAALSTRTGSSTIIALENFPRALPSPGDVPPSVLPLLVGAWLLGVALFSLRFAGGFLLLEHRRRRQSIAPSPRILALCHELQRQFGMDRAIRYLECSWLQAPAVIGWIRPIVLLPVTALTGLSEDQLRAVIAHELAHIRRFDVFANLFQILVETLLFYHPATWWLNRRIRAERELCCDEMAVSLTGNRLEYARALTLMAEWKTAPMLAMAANRGSLSERILHILGRKSSGAGPRMAGLTGSILFLAAALGAANALFGIAYPIPAAHATESLKAALSSGQVAVDHAVRQALQATATNTDAKPDQTGSPETAAPDQIASAQNSQAEKLVPPSPDLSRLVLTETIVTPTLVASNDAPAPVQPAQELPIGPGQGALNNPIATPVRVSSSRPRVAQACLNNTVTGRVISSETIQMQVFSCILSTRNDQSILSARTEQSPAPDVALPGPPNAIRYGSCPDWGTPTDTRLGQAGCKPDVTMNVQLADPADASKMQPGKMVRLAGHFFRGPAESNSDYLTVTKAKVIWVDPFDRSAAAAGPASKASPATALASNDKSAAPMQPARHEPPAGQIQVAENNATVAPANAGSNGTPSAYVQTANSQPPSGATPSGLLTTPGKIVQCNFGGHSEATDLRTPFTGRVISPSAIAMSGFFCFGRPGNSYKYGNVTGYGPTSYEGLVVTLEIQFRDPKDAARMQVGKTVRLLGDVYDVLGDLPSVRHRDRDRLVMSDARFAD